MGITHEDFQKARRISRAIQEYLEMSNKEGVRSTDIYPYLAKKGLIEKDRHDGLHLRRFLIKLKENNLLRLIPQCTCNPGLENQFNEWYFYKARSPMPEAITEHASNPAEPNLIIPDISEIEINELITIEKLQIEKLPKRDISSFTIQEQEIRANYPRAYEYWTDLEIAIMKKAFTRFKRIDKVAELLDRQPSVVEERLRKIGHLESD